jgi:hypothetical protein
VSAAKTTTARAERRALVRARELRRRDAQNRGRGASVALAHIDRVGMGWSSVDRATTATADATLRSWAATSELASVMTDDVRSAPPSLLDLWLRARETPSDPLEDDRDAELEALDRIWESGRARDVPGLRARGRALHASGRGVFERMRGADVREMTITDEVRLVQGLSSWGLASVQVPSGGTRGGRDMDDDDDSMGDVNNVSDDFQEAA